MDEIKLGIVGAGGHATNRIYPYIAPAGGKLVGVCDLDSVKAAANANRFGGTAYTDVNAMLDRENPDAVMICIGPEAHVELSQLVMKRGLPVYTEKPPSLVSSDALTVARVSAETGKLCTTAFKKRYSNAYARARRWIDGFAAEDLFSLSVDYASAEYPEDGVGRSSFLLDFAIHLIDLVGYLFGDIGEVFCFAKGPHAYAVSLKFCNGAVGSMNLNDGRSFAVPTEEVELTARGGNFMSIHNSSCWRITENGQPSEWREPPTFVSGGDDGNNTGHLAEIVDFVNAIKEGRSTRSNIYESYKSMVLYEAIAESARTGKVVKVEYEEL